MSHNLFERLYEFTTINYDNGIAFVAFFSRGIIPCWQKFIDKEALSVTKLCRQNITGHTTLFKRGDKPKGNITPLALCFRQHMGCTLSVETKAGSKIFGFANIMQFFTSADRFVQSINSTLFGFGLIQSLIKWEGLSPLNSQQFNSHLPRSLSGVMLNVNQNYLFSEGEAWR